MMGSLGAWGWLALGLALIALEMLVLPGGFPLWIGIAAMLMAGITAVSAPGWTTELILFSVLALCACVVAWKLHYRTGRTDAADALNDRIEPLLGREFVLDQGTETGIGRIRIDDTAWRVRGPVMASGVRVRVTGADGSTLIVERI